MSEYNVWYELANMVPAPAAVAEPVVMYKTEDGVLAAYGTTVPSTADVYAVGCEFVKVDGTNKNVRYINVGTKAVPVFEAVTTSAGQSGTAAGRGPSPAIWDDVPIANIIADPTLGTHFFNEFNEGPVGANNASDYTGEIGWDTSATAGSVVTPQADQPTGVVRIETTTINEGGAVAALYGGNVAGNFLPSRTWAMEARVSFLNITDSKFAAFLGFAEEALLAEASLIANATPWDLADVDLFGFHKLNADGDALDTRHNTNGGGGLTDVANDAVTIAADTKIKLGMKCDGTTITFYVNGVALADTVLLAATNFPDDQEMAFYFVLMAGHGDLASIDIDWVRIAQLY